MFIDLLQPCQDVFTMPLMKPVFGQHVIEEMEQYGGWSSGIEVFLLVVVSLATRVYYIYHMYHLYILWWPGDI